MGGWNSGRNNRGAGRCERYHRVELASLRQRKALVLGRRCVISWSCGGEPSGSIDFHAFQDHAELRFVCQGETVKQRILYRYTATNFGGRRLRFACPRCDRSCDVLYGGHRFLCRLCLRLTYSSQYGDEWERARDQAQRIWRKLGGSIFVDDDIEDFPPKPKWMRWRTYERLKLEKDWLVDVYGDGFSMMVAGFLKRYGN